MEVLTKPVISAASQKVQIAPNHYAMYNGSKSKQAPTTKLGAIAHNIVQQTAITVLSVAATTGYVYALTQSAPPQITFTDVPPNIPTSALAELQGAYDNFLTQFAVFQGNAAAWISTQQSTATASIFSQLVSVPNTLNLINSTVTSNFTLLNALTPSSPAYNSLLLQQENTIGAEQPAIHTLYQAMQTLGNTLASASETLITSTQTGILSQLLAAYATDIQALKTDIDNANQQISADNSKIIGEGVGAAVSVTVGVVGLLNFWNPLGWVMMAGGAIGAYYAIEEIEFLKAQIAALRNKIYTDTNFESLDQQAASLLSAFCTQLQGFASLNQASQKELLALENLYTTLNTDISDALTDLQQNELAQAQAEWTAILQEGQFLQGLTAYIWPSPIMLSSPSSFAAVGNDIYSVSLSGEMFHYTNGAWTDMGITALSCVGQGTTLVAIDGAPIDGSTTTPQPVNSTYFVKSYNMAAKSWSTISNFPAAAIAVGSTGIYAINQTAADRQVYQYTGTGTNWNKLKALPGPDAAIQIAVAGGIVFALTNNSQFVYQYDPSSTKWTQVGTFECCQIKANGNKLALLGTDNSQYLYDPTVGGTPLYTGHAVVSVAQLTNGNQYGVNTWQDLWLAEPTTPITYTYMVSNVTGVFASDTNLVYYTDNLGNIYQLSATGQATLLPVMP